MDGTDDFSAPHPNISSRDSIRGRYHRHATHFRNYCAIYHNRIPYLRKLPLRCALIILLLIIVNLIAWCVCGIILAFHQGSGLLGTAAVAYSLGLRHALDADHICAIDLMTRRLIATGQRPVTVGTFFSLGHSTIVIITSIAVAASSARVADRFKGFGNVGGIIGTSVSASFLIILGLLNGYILYRLIIQMRHVISLQPAEAESQAWQIKQGGFLFRFLKRLFQLIDRPWKMYPIGVLFGLGFDTSTEIALLGISSIEAAKGTSFWLILIFPALFTSGMCLIDTTDGALMMGLYVAPINLKGTDAASSNTLERSQPVPDHSAPSEANAYELVHIDNARPIKPTLANEQVATTNDVEAAPTTLPERAEATTSLPQEDFLASPTLRTRVRDPLTFLYYSIVLTTLTCLCALAIGVIQVLSLIQNVVNPPGAFWAGVATAGDNFDIIGTSICATFVVTAVVSGLCYRPWRRVVDRRRQEAAATKAEAARLGGGAGTVVTVVAVDGCGQAAEAGPSRTAGQGPLFVLGNGNDDRRAADGRGRREDSGGARGQCSKTK